MLAEWQQRISTAHRTLFSAVEFSGRVSVICEVTIRTKLNAMIDIYTATICSHMHQKAPALPNDISSGILRLTVGLCLLAGILGQLS
jgi:hypothetical protein